MKNNKLKDLPTSTMSVNKNFAQDQAEFMDICGQKRLSLLETLKALNERDKFILNSFSMHFGLIEEEVLREAKVHFYDRVLHPMPSPDPEAYNIDTLVELADDMIDAMYVICSFMNKLGMPVQELWNEVHGSNMNKAVECTACQGRGQDCDTNPCRECKGTGLTVVRRADGKILKPDGWTKPNIKAIILKHLGEEIEKEQQAIDRG